MRKQLPNTRNHNEYFVILWYCTDYIIQFIFAKENRKYSYKRCPRKHNEWVRKQLLIILFCDTTLWSSTVLANFCWKYPCFFWLLRFPRKPNDSQDQIIKTSHDVYDISDIFYCSVEQPVTKERELRNREASNRSWNTQKTSALMVCAPV